MAQLNPKHLLNLSVRAHLRINSSAGSILSVTFMISLLTASLVNKGFRKYRPLAAFHAFIAEMRDGFSFMRFYRLVIHFRLHWRCGLQPVSPIAVTLTAASRARGVASRARLR